MIALAFLAIKAFSRAKIHAYRIYCIRIKRKRREMLKTKRRTISVIVAVGLGMSFMTAASAATKTLTCYKGTTVKKITAAKPKCPTGYSKTKPVAVKTGAIAFNATYKGTMAIVWSDTSVQAPTINATGTGSNMGLTSMTGKGSSAPQAQCNPFQGNGVLSGGGNTLNVEFSSSSEACADSDAAPANVSLNGIATITGGTGRYVGAKGTLKATGSFAIKSTVAGSKESSSLTITLVGSVITK